MPNQQVLCIDDRASRKLSRKPVVKGGNPVTRVIFQNMPDPVGQAAANKAAYPANNPRDKKIIGPTNNPYNWLFLIAAR